MPIAYKQHQVLCYNEGWPPHGPIDTHYAYTYSNINAAFVFVKVCLEYMEGKNHLITNLLFEFYEILYK